MLHLAEAAMHRLRGVRDGGPVHVRQQLVAQAHPKDRQAGALSKDAPTDACTNERSFKFG